jgi:hypothetical protein
LEIITQQKDMCFKSHFSFASIMFQRVNKHGKTIKKQQQEQETTSCSIINRHHHLHHHHQQQQLSVSHTSSQRR